MSNEYFYRVGLGISGIASIIISIRKCVHHNKPLLITGIHIFLLGFIFSNMVKDGLCLKKRCS
uniref:Uncharacterized protein n=1 Tax=viral metagenome TaxID=1070528 RepID=A0A6C0IUK8_9ZZZZ